MGVEDIVTVRFVALVGVVPVIGLGVDSVVVRAVVGVVIAGRAESVDWKRVRSGCPTAPLAVLKTTDEKTGRIGWVEMLLLSLSLSFS